MPIDDLAGEVLGAAVELVGDFVEEVVAEPPRRNRFRRFLYWSVLALLGGCALLVVGYLALS